MLCYKYSLQLKVSGTWTCFGVCKSQSAEQTAKRVSGLKSRGFNVLQEKKRTFQRTNRISLSHKCAFQSDKS